MSDHELNLWAAKFMGYKELPADNRSYWYDRCRGDGIQAFERQGERIGLAGGGFWEPLANPSQAAVLMAEAARQGIQISVTVSATQVFERFRGLALDDPGASADDLVSLWCRVVVMSLYDRAKEINASLPEAIHV